MNFEAQGAVFKQTDQDNQRKFGDRYDPNKNYPNFRGKLLFKRDDLIKLVEYFHYASNLEDLRVEKFSYYNKETGKNELQEHLAVPLEISGYTSKDGRVPRFSFKAEPLYPVLMKAMEAKKAAKEKKQSASVRDAAATLAEGTAGQVVEPKHDDFFD